MRTSEKLFFNNLAIKKVVDNKGFWESVFSLFCIKWTKGDKIVLNENDKRVSNVEKLCQFFCGYFSNIIPEL